MAINLYVCKPERIRDIKELEEIIERMNTYRKDYIAGHTEIGVLYIQNR